MKGATDGSGVVVANPSSTPEIVHASSALARASLLARYHAPVATTERLEARLGRVLPGALARPILTELRRRPLPPGVTEEQHARTATATDLFRVGASRLPPPVGRRLAIKRRHFASFDAAVARRLTTHDGGLLTVVGTATRSARRARALGVPVVLDIPIAHMTWIRRLMREEARLVPEYAMTLQCHDVADADLTAQEEEYRIADRLLVLSSHERATLLEEGVDEAKMISTPLGVDLEMFAPAPRVEDGVFRVIFVGQITQRKGLSYLVEGFRRAALPRSELVLVGVVIGSDAPWRDIRGVRHVAPVPRSQLPAVYATADVYVLPSLAEGFPLTQMEAMAMGLPVIVSEHTSARDVVSDGVDGWVVSIRNAEAITERLRVLYSDPDRRARMGAAARARAMDFSWDRYGARLVDVIHSLP